MMDPSKRIFVNTIAQYTKSFINVCLSLYTVPLILKALVKIIERFEYANGNWRLTYNFFQLPLKVCIEVYIRNLIGGAKE